MFYLVENDHITHRVLHVQFVAKIGRVIGRSLMLNEDLIEAISLGHDVGHTPYGHNGEVYLDKICDQNKIGCFVHNAQSVRFLSEIENNGNGLNLTFQVLDGILCHNGEILAAKYKPAYGKNYEDHIKEYQKCFTIKKYDRKLVPATLEGCVMRIADVIAYCGRDFEDAITLKLITKKDLPEKVKNVLGNTNDRIINNLVIDLINNSYEKDYLAFSAEVYDAFKALKKFNEENIYNHPLKKAQDNKIENMFNWLFEKYLKELKTADKDSFIFNWAKKKVGEQYINNNHLERIVVDYISGMTDDFINKEFVNTFVPKTFGYNFKQK